MVSVREGTFVPCSDFIFMDVQACAQPGVPSTHWLCLKFPGVLCDLLLFCMALPKNEEGHVARDSFKIQCGWRMFHVNLRI